MVEDRFSAHLPELKQFLDSLEMETEIQAPNDLNPVEQLLIRLGKDTENQELILRLFWLPEAEHEVFSKAENFDADPRFLQFYILFPFLIVESAYAELTSLLFQINSSFDMAQFGLFEGKMVYYRFVHVCAHGQVEGQAVQAILLSIQFLIEALLPAIMEVALARKTLKQVQEEARKAIKEAGLDTFS